MSTQPVDEEMRTSAGPVPWHLARWALLGMGLYLALVALVGFAVDASFPTSQDAVLDRHGHIFGVLETNGWHNLAALAAGLPAVVIAMWVPRLVRVGLAALGAGNLVVFLAFEVWGAETFWVASNTADQVVHVAVALVGLGLVLATRSTPQGRAF